MFQFEYTIERYHNKFNVVSMETAEVVSTWDNLIDAQYDIERRSSK